MYLRFFKRPFDVLLAISLSVVFSWLLILILLVYVLSFQFPILFMQKRIGRYQRPFTIYKFRTLSTNDQLPLMERRLWLGDVLRFFSLDELPQLWNVLKGDMSMVGPRPLPLEYLSLMDEAQLRRHEVRPGITGETQLKDRHRITWSEKFAKDIGYVHHVSFRGDISIILRTIFLFLTPRKDVSFLEEKFKGN